MSSVIEWEVYKAQHIELAKETKRLEDDRVSWYAMIMGQLSPASKQLVQANNDWNNVERDKDPLQLWQIITATHIVARTGNPAMDNRAALLAFNTIEQRDGETLPDYRLRLQQCVQVLEAIKHPHIPSAEEQVFQFIVGMRGKYSAYSQHIQNDMIEGVATPATIAEAEHEAEHWRQEISGASTPRNQRKRPRELVNKLTRRQMTMYLLLHRRRAVRLRLPITPASFAGRLAIRQSNVHFGTR